MENKKIIGIFHTEEEVLDKIGTLKVQGFLEEDIYIVTNDAESLSMVRGRTDVDLTSAEGSWMDRFKAFITGDEPVQETLNNMGFTEEDTSIYTTAVKNGAMLLYVDRHSIDTAYHHDSNSVNEHLDANLGSNLTVDYTREPAVNEAFVEEETLETPIFTEKNEEVDVLRNNRNDFNNSLGIDDHEPLNEVAAQEGLDDFESNELLTDFEDNEAETERDYLKNNTLNYRDRPL